MANLRSKQFVQATLSASATAPAVPTVGERWFNTATAVTYQYTVDAAGTKFWLDVSSGGIPGGAGSTGDRAVDIVGDTDPHLEINGTAAVGSIYYNREANRYFTCTDATNDANVWYGRYAGLGGIEHTTLIKVGSDFYKFHTFLESGTFYLDTSTVCDIFMVGGGGSGGNGLAGGGAGGAVLWGVDRTVAAGSHTVTVGAGGIINETDNENGTNGGNTVFSTYTALGGGMGQGQNNSAVSGTGVANGGGRVYANTSAVVPTGQVDYAGFTEYAGNNGGVGHGSSNGWQSAGGAGAAAVGGNGIGNGVCGVGGAGQQVNINLHNHYWAGGGGGSGHVANGPAGDGGIGGGGGGAMTHEVGNKFGSGGASGYLGASGGDGATGENSSGGSALANSGSGGGAGANGVGNGGAGGSGIVIVRYKVNQ